MNLVIDGLLAICLVTQVVLLCLIMRWSPRAVVRAFEGLEQDFEELRDHVASSLGRISRLRRATIEASRETPEVDLISQATSGLPLTPRQAKLQAEILRRRQKGESEAKPS